MSLATITDGRLIEKEIDWARLIPGELPGAQSPAKKKPKSVWLHTRKKSLATGQNRSARPQDAFAFFKPRPLRSRRAWKLLCALSTDWALVVLNWLMIGAVLVPLHSVFPYVWSFGYAAGTPIALLGLAVLQAALITLIGHTEGLYACGSDLRTQREILAKSTVWAMSLLCAAYSLQGYPWTIGCLICAAGALQFCALWGWRWRLGDAGNGSRSDLRNVLIVGGGEMGRRVAATISHWPNSGRKVCGFLDDDACSGDGVLGRMTDLPRIARREFVDEIIVTAAADTNLTRWVVNAAYRLHLDVEIVPEWGCESEEEEIERVGDLPLICLHAERLPVLALFLKKLLDVAVACVALLMFAPVLAIIATLIKLDSAGPVLYSAPRAGRKGQLFRCFKFRTMVSNADRFKAQLRDNNERVGPFFKMWNDPRITRVGKFLRRYSLDELPQLWNVIRGEMSLVGPRPHPLDDVAQYQIGHLARMDVSPGITGLWQVTARRDPSFERGMELDREYIRRWSLGLDVRILLRTLQAVVHGSGD